MKQFACKTVMVCIAITLSSFSFSQQRINIGDAVPDFQISQLINDDAGFRMLHSFKGKYLILDFWATWCTPCIKFFETADSLQSEYKDKLVILPVTYETKEIAAKFLDKYQKKTGIKIASIVNDTLLQKMFPHTEIPHEIWIDKDGIVKAITGSSDVNRENINSFITGKTLAIQIKVDQPIVYSNGETPLFLAADAIGKVSPDEVLNESILTKFNKNVGAGYVEATGAYGIPYSRRFITATNQTPLQLFKLALGRGDASFANDNRCILEVEDTLEVHLYRNNYGLYKEWRKDHTYCYELSLKDPSSYGYAYDIMYKDIAAYFKGQGIVAEIVPRNTKCWVLTRTSKIDKIKTKGGAAFREGSAYDFTMRNMPVKEFVTNELQSYRMQYSRYPLIDGTNYPGNIDISLECQLSNIDEINTALAKYDLIFKLEDRMIDMILIRQQPNK